MSDMLVAFLPIALFIALYVGSGIYCSLLGVENAFYQLSPIVAILPALACAWLLRRDTTQGAMQAFLDGMRHSDILTMCCIFLLAGAFSSVTQSIGSVDSLVAMALSHVSSHWLLVGIFLTSAIISFAIGTSMGTIVTIGPLVAGLARQDVVTPVLSMATVVGGAMFGDNLSLISDTTIASVLSQEANMKAKLKLNAVVATIASLITIVILFFMHEAHAVVQVQTYSLFLLIPYVVLVGLALFGMNVFYVLFFSLLCAWGVGYLHHDYSFFALSHDIVKGFASMHEIMVLSLLVGGLSGLMGNRFEVSAQRLVKIFVRKGNSRVGAQLAIAGLVLLFDMLLANNTIAIIFIGKLARDIAQRWQIPAHYSAAWLDIFSCVMQGLIPYGAQLLLASSMVGVSPLQLVPHVYYCYVLAFVALVYIGSEKQMKIS